ncbi:MAG: hypothetical protein RIS43_650, partial [Actinomycetota bacterium]
MTQPLVSYIQQLPEGFSVRTSTAADVKGCTELVRAVDIAACGETTTTEAELESDICGAAIVRDQSSVVILHENKVVALLTCFNEAAEDRNIFFDFFIHPDLDNEIAKTISLAAVLATENYTSDVAKSLARES